MFELDLYQWVLLPFLIFLSRVADVSLGTIRLIFIGKGMRYWAPVVGFFEIFVWLLAMGEVMKNLSNPISYIAYAGGFAAGSYIGIIIGDKLSLGKVLVRIITQQNADSLIKAMFDSGYGVTTVDGKGAYGQVKIIFSVIPRKKQTHIFQLAAEHNPRAFCTVAEVGQTSEGVFPIRQTRYSLGFRRLRKGK